MDILPTSTAITTTQPQQTSVIRPKRKPGPRNPADIPKQQRISALVKAGCEVLIEGHANNITEAAKLIGCTREHLSKMLSKPHVEDYFAREKKRKLFGAVTTARAAHVFTTLLDCENAKVRQDVADRLLTADGTMPNAKGAQTTNVNVGVSVGYVIKLKDRHGELLETTAESIT